VEAYPGCGKHRVLDAVARDASYGGVDQAAAYQVVAWDMPQSADTFCYFLLRQIEAALDEAPGSRGDQKKVISKKLLLEQVENGIRDLEAAGKRALVAVGDLHLGANPVRAEHRSILDVYRKIGAQNGNHLILLATTHPGATRERIPYDHRVAPEVALAGGVSWPVPDVDALDLSEISHELKRLSCDQPGSMHARVLSHLAASDQQEELFALCNALDADAEDAVFEPEVERTLWDLRPVLQLKKDEVEVEGRLDVRKIWGLYSPAVQTALENLGAEA
jgi:hypothetical protein